MSGIPRPSARTELPAPADIGQIGVGICREGWYFIVVLAFIAAGAILREVNLLFVLAGLMMGPLLVNWRMAVVTLRDLRWTRKLPDSIAAGDTLHVDIAIESLRQSMDSWGLVATERIERIAPAGDPWAKDVEIRFPHVAAGDSQREGYEGKLPRRGVYRFGPLVVRTRFPLGLVEGQYTADETQELIVCPRLGRLTRSWLRLLQIGPSGSESKAHQQGSVEGEFFGIRDWQPGDSRRWIHWKTSARRQKLAVRQFEIQHRPDLAIVLDLWQPEVPSLEQETILERAVSFVATAVHDLAQRPTGRLLVAIAGKTIEILSGGSSQSLYRGVAELLAVSESSSEDRRDEAIAEVRRRVAPGTMTLIVTTRPSGRLKQDPAAPVVGAIPEMAREVVTIHADGEELGQYYQEG